MDIRLTYLIQPLLVDASVAVLSDNRFLFVWAGGIRLYSIPDMAHVEDGLRPLDVITISALWAHDTEQWDPVTNSKIGPFLYDSISGIGSCVVITGNLIHVLKLSPKSSRSEDALTTLLPKTRYFGQRVACIRCRHVIWSQNSDDTGLWVLTFSGNGLSKDSFPFQYPMDCVESGYFGLDKGLGHVVIDVAMDELTGRICALMNPMDGTGNYVRVLDHE